MTREWAKQQIEMMMSGELADTEPGSDPWVWILFYEDTTRDGMVFAPHWRFEGGTTVTIRCHDCGIVNVSMDVGVGDQIRERGHEVAAEVSVASIKSGQHLMAAALAAGDEISRRLKEGLR